MSERVQTRARKRAKSARAPAKKRPGRKPGQTSPAIAAAARENGVNGGRPRDRLPEEVLTRLGPPPATPRELRTWNARGLAEMQLLVMRGAIGHELAATLRAGATALDRSLPSSTDDGASDDPDDDSDDEELDGPELEPDDDAAAGDPLRVG